MFIDINFDESIVLHTYFGHVPTLLTIYVGGIKVEQVGFEQ